MNSKVQPPSWWALKEALWQELLAFFTPTTRSSFDTLSNQLSLASNWLPLSLGQTNSNFKLTLMDKCYFVQIKNKQNSDLQPTVDFQKLNQQLQLHTNIEPWLVNNLYESTHIKIDDWFDSSSITNKLFHNPEFIRSIVNFLVHLHYSDSFFSTRGIQLPAIQIEEYVRRYRQLALTNAPQETKSIEIYFHQSVAFTKYFRAECYCHNDLTLENLLYSEHGILKIIDWEYSGWGDPLMDLANLIISCQLSSQQEHSLLEKYSKTSNKNIDLERLSQMKRLIISINHLWHLASQKKERQIQ
ncbi:MAG: phosphotransferase [Kangiellaceae bacterium]|nr:phosphotransferase [Kangiellaceae bacterium]